MTINDLINILKSDYTEFSKPNLNNEDNIGQERSSHEILTHHLRFGGFNLSLFLSKCDFTSNTNVTYECLEGEDEIRVVELEYDKYRAIELKVLVGSATRFLIDELQNIIPENNNLYNNLDIFNFELLKE